MRVSYDLLGYASQEYSRQARFAASTHYHERDISLASRVDDSLRRGTFEGYGLPRRTDALQSVVQR